MINDYISVLTNDTAVRYNKIDTSTYQWNNDRFVNTNEPSLIYKPATKTLHMANGRYDNEKRRFTLLDVQYTDPSDQTNTVFHLYIPVLVKKLLERGVLERGLNLLAPIELSRDMENYEDWYVPSIKPGHFDDSQFNDYERHNVDTIVNYMKEKGYR